MVTFTARTARLPPSTTSTKSVPGTAHRALGPLNRAANPVPSALPAVAAPARVFTTLELVFSSRRTLLAVSATTTAPEGMTVRPRLPEKRAKSKTLLLNPAAPRPANGSR